MLLPTDLVADVYRAVTEPGRWSDVVGRVTMWAGGVAGGFTLRSTWPELSTSQVWSGLDPAFERAYTEHYFRSDPWFERAGDAEEGMTLLSQELVSDDEYLKSAFYNELCKPFGLRDLQASVLIREGSRVATFGMFRPEGASFDEGTKKRLQTIAPHLRRALRIAFDLDDRGRNDAVLAAASAARRLGVVRVDASLHVLSESSGAAEWLEGDGGPLRVAKRRLVAPDEGDEAALRAAVAAAITGRTTNVVLGRQAGDLVSVLVVPAPGGSLFAPEKSAHVLFSAPAEAARVHALRDAFSLTPAEARVAVKVARGQPLRTIATDLGVSYHTVRAHLRQCFAKTGARRQSALAALVHDSA